MRRKATKKQGAPTRCSREFFYSVGDRLLDESLHEALLSPEADRALAETMSPLYSELFTLDESVVRKVMLDDQSDEEQPEDSGGERSA